MSSSTGSWCVVGRQPPLLLRILQRVIGRVSPAAVAALGFAGLALVVGLGGTVGWREAVAAAFSGLAIAAVQVAGGAVGWKGRLAEVLLLPPATALLLVGDGDRRKVVVAVLLTGAAVAAAAVNLPVAPTRRRAWCALALAVAVLSASTGALPLPALWPWAVVALAATAAAAYWGSADAALLVGATLPLAVLARPGLLPWGAFLGLAAAASLPHGRGVVRRLLPLAMAAGLAGAALAPWASGAPWPLLPRASWLAFAFMGLAVVLLPRLPAALVGASWFVACLALGPLQPPPLAGRKLLLSASSPRAFIDNGGAGELFVETSLANAAAVPDDTVVAVIGGAGFELPLRAGREAVEWAHGRGDVRGRVAHRLPTEVVFHPRRGEDTFWPVAGRLRVAQVAEGPLTVARAAALPAAVTVTVTAGPAVPTPPRRWPAAPFLLAAAVAVAVLQLASRGWAGRAALVPWVVLTGASLAARLPVAPLQGVVDRHGVDVALAALLAAWLPAARTWFRSGRIVRAAASLLVPIALATPHLTPPLYGDEPYHLAILDALMGGASLAEAVAAGAPPGHAPLHGPVLAVLLLPGFAVGGRSGALVELALAASVVVALVVRRARAWGVVPRRLAVVASLLVATAPLATYASQIWPEVAGALAVAASLTLATGGPMARWATVGMAVLASAIKTRLGLFCFPVALASLWPGKGRVGRWLVRAVGLALAGIVALAVAKVFLGHLLGAPRSLASLLAIEPRRAVLVVGGLLFDPAGGLLFAAPLVVFALLGVSRLWRHGSGGERAALVGFGLTVAALLHSIEWYGGGSPPGRYLVAGMPVLWLAGAWLVRRPPAWLAAAPLALPLAVLSWWALVTRPHFAINPGNGRVWLGDLLAERFRTDTRHLVPSFLVPSPATLVVPLGISAAVILLVVVARQRPSWPRRVARHAVACWLAGAAALAWHLEWRTDTVVEVEDPQVGHEGGRVEPPAGTWSTYLHCRGWRVGDGEAVVVPLRLAAGSRLTLVGWLEGAARDGCTLEVQWNDAPPLPVAVAGEGIGSVALPPPETGGRHRLRLGLRAPSGGEAVLDRLVVAR